MKEGLMLFTPLVKSALKRNNINPREFKEMEDMKLLTTKQVAQIISDLTGYPMQVRQVQKEIEKGYIKAEKIGGVYLIKESSLKNYERWRPGRPTGARKKSKK